MKKILVIEDNADVRENIAEILELSNYEVLQAPDGKAGVEVAMKDNPDLIICDIMMPVLDGYGVLHLLSKHKETFGIPFIFLTAKSEKADFRKGMELGADDYITKPFDGIELLNAVEIRLKKTEVLKKSSSESSNKMKEFLDAARQSDNIKLISDEREVYDFRKKQMIYSEGQRPKAVYYVITGKIKIYKSSKDGKELITAICGPEDFFGYTYILENANYTENAQVLEDAQLMLIPREDFITLTTNDTQIAKQFIKIITRNILEKEEALVNLAYNSLRKKVAYGLAQVLDKYKKENNKNEILELSRENLAQITGVATESLIRTLADFKSEKLISIEPGKIIVLNEKKLRDLPY
ncbi:MAG: response regulator [Bacteroidetes bacterium]|nr:response regulator [Bacteroidota bacterium]MBS1975110.1 response regulator [Bacteroidota bacterium]